MKYMGMALITVLSLNAMEDGENSLVEVPKERRISAESYINAERAIILFLGNASPHNRHIIASKLYKKVRESNHDDSKIWDALTKIKEDPLVADNSEANLLLKEIKKYLVQSIDEEINEKSEAATENLFQLEAKIQELKTQKYKFYGALAGLGTTLIASAVTIITLATTA